MGTSIKKNFIYSSFLTTANYIFPLITFPYITRVLGVSNIGICDFVDSIINYFILLSSLGIGVVGIREIAIVKDDCELLSKIFSELLTLLFIFTVTSLVILFFCTIFIQRLWEYKELMFLGGFKLLFSSLLIEWFYKGLENFKYITIRTLIIKLLYVVSVFIFVRTSSDYSTYYLLTVLMIGVNAVTNNLYAKKRISFRFSFPSKIVFFSLIIYGAYTILTSFYTTFNVVFLGFSTNTTQVGYYTTASRLFSIFIAFFSAFTGVMLPRMSSLVEQRKIAEFKQLYVKSIDLLCSITIPMVFVSIGLARSIIEVIAGPGYEGAIIPMRIVMPLLFIIGYEQVLVIQALMPLKKDKTVLINSSIGAFFGVIGNIFFVSHLGAIGSTLVWVSCEILILILSQIAVFRDLQISFPIKKIARYVVIYSPLLLLEIIHSRSPYITLLFGGFIFILYFLGMQLTIFKSSFLSNRLQVLFYNCYGKYNRCFNNNSKL